MEFGKIPAAALAAADLTLPPDGAFTKSVLPGKPAKNPQVYVGAAKWGRTEWDGIIYPHGTKEKDFLAQYVQHFNSIELNATHYKIYGEATIRKWAEKAAGRDFKFCPKVPQSISHYSDLGSLRAKELTDQFLEGIVAFGDHLGPVFLQVSEKYAPERKEQLLHYLAHWPKDLELFVEVRHPAWFADTETRSWLFGNLHNLGIGAVITDTAGRRDCLHMETTIPKTMIRFVGNGRHATDFTRIDAWVQRLKTWIANGVEETCFFMHQPNELYTPEMALYFIERLNAVCGLSVPQPKFIESRQTLFD